MVIRGIAVIAILTAGAFLRDTNSSAEVRRGLSHYQRKQHDKSIESFAGAARLRPGPLSSFNLGTAHVAAGNFAEGAKHLAKSLEDSSLRADAYYNRGNSALSANAFDHAIRDYISALKLRPGDGEAKRNLEIALLRKQAAQRSQPQPQRRRTPQQEQGEERQEPAPGEEQRGQSEQADADVLLRSVEQQEREELSRMRRARGEQRRIGW